MIVVGVDPGGRQTGITAVDTSVGYGAGDPGVLDRATVTSTGPNNLLAADPTYLRDVATTVVAMISTHGAELLAVEGLVEPNPHVRLTNPAGLVATGITFGALLGRSWGIPVVVVRPHGNGARPWAKYPRELLTSADVTAARRHPLASAGKSARCHERSAYDVARQGPAALALSRNLRSVYAYVS